MFNLYGDIIGFAGTTDKGNVGDTLVVDKKGTEYLTSSTPSASGRVTQAPVATGRVYRQLKNPDPVTPPIVEDTGTIAPASDYTGGSREYRSSVVSGATTMSSAEALAQAKRQFLETYGNDPDWQARLAEYQGDIDAAYESILGEEGPLAEGRRLAEEAFRRQTENVQTGFRESRQQLAEQAYLGQRGLQQQLAQRGLGGSGLAQLGDVQQTISQGRAQSNLYNQFTQSLESLAASEAKSMQEFSQAEANLKMALDQQKLSIKQQLDQEQQAYQQFKGQTINALQAAIKSNNYQDYQMVMQDYQLTRQLEQETRQKQLDGLSYTTQLIERSYQSLLAEAEKMSNTTARNEMIEKLNADLVAELEKAGRDLSVYNSGLAPEGLVEGLMGRYDFDTANRSGSVGQYGAIDEQGNYTSTPSLGDYGDYISNRYGVK